MASSLIGSASQRERNRSCIERPVPTCGTARPKRRIGPQDDISKRVRLTSTSSPIGPTQNLVIGLSTVMHVSRNKTQATPRRHLMLSRRWKRTSWTTSLRSPSSIWTTHSESTNLRWRTSRSISIRLRDNWDAPSNHSSDRGSLTETQPTQIIHGLARMSDFMRRRKVCDEKRPFKNCPQRRFRRS